LIPGARRRSDESALFAQRGIRAGPTSSEGVTAFATYARLAGSGRLSPMLAAALDGDRDALLWWYVTDFAPLMRPGRAPLSAVDLSYLLAPDPLSANAAGLPRVVVWSLLCEPRPRFGLSGALDPETAFWWTCERAPALFAEDCLVPDAFIRLLTAPDPTGVWATVLERIVSERQGELAILQVMRAPRAAVDGFLAVLAIDQPGLLRFTAPRAVEAAFYEPLLDVVGQKRDGAAACLSRRFRNACTEAGFDAALHAYATLDGIGNRSLAAIEPHSPGLLRIKADIEIVGPLRQCSGLGQATRRSIETFQTAGVRVKATDFSLGFPSPDEPDVSRQFDTCGEAGATLFHLNPDMLPRAFAFGPGGYARRRAGFFYWELDAPASCDFLAFDLVDAIWTATRFVQDVYAPTFTGPVDCVGLAMPPLVLPNRACAREALLQATGLGGGGFVAISVFDGFSYAARKNPDGAIRAFQAAFPDRADAAMVLKVHNRPQPGAAGKQGEIWSRIAVAAEADPRIKILDETVAHADVLRLVAGADLLVSLHRSEGFGLGVAEAMQVGTPVVVTAYGGTEDFCSDATAFRVPCALVPVAGDEYVHAEPGRVWAEPEIVAAARAIRTASEDRGLALGKAAAAARRIGEAHSYRAVAPAYVAALERLLAKP